MPLVLLVLITTASRAAEPTLLLEFQDAHGSFDSPTLHAEFVARRYYPNQIDFSHNFDFHHDREELTQFGGKVFTNLPPNGTIDTAEPPVVAGFDDCFHDATCGLYFQTATYTWERSFNVDDIWSYQPRYGERLDMLVPRLGPGLTGYRLTSITREINDASLYFEYKPDGIFYYGYYHGNIAQTIRIYGEAIPEPSSLLLALLGCVAYLGRRSYSPRRW